MSYLEELLKKAKEERKAQAIATAEKEAEKKEAVPEEKKEEKTLVDSYGDVRIYKVQGDPLFKYEVPVPHYRGEEKALIEALVEIAASVIETEPGYFGTEEERRRKYFDRIMKIIDASPELKIPIHAKEFYADAVVKEMIGYGLIDALVRDDNLEDILIIGSNRPVYVHHRKYEMMKTNIVFYEDKDIRNLIERVARIVGRRIDFQVPLLDARLPDGTRVNATLPPISLDGSTLSLRKFRKDPFTIIDLINLNTLSSELAAFLWMCVDGLGAYPANILVAGGTAAGKTTTLNVLASFVPADERIVTIEDTAELNLPLPHLVRFETRPPGLEGTGEITMNDLVKNSLRMRPDRIIVGEIRGAEGFTMFAAMNTGHKGCLGTVHSNSARETLVRLESPPISVPHVMLSALNFILMEQRIHDRKRGTIRRITELTEVIAGNNDKLELQTLYSWNPLKDTQEKTEFSSNFLQLLTKYTGLTKKELLEELSERENKLKEMSKKGVRDINSVCEITQNYVLKKKLKT
ncbi:CpaF family protein [Candidatus Micrarchaeota archaeon]|nr:CpaF family protein [Candidatus Micrarchaeota archaeon]